MQYTPNKIHSHSPLEVVFYSWSVVGHDAAHFDGLLPRSAWFYSNPLVPSSAYTGIRPVPPRQTNNM
ncbi:hypothetical protein OPQ81_007270 [Rhizoctonia solani]|nr:hypothetical protein OPQ81_007270 [Rhizoctonia solani]